MLVTPFNSRWPEITTVGSRGTLADGGVDGDESLRSAALQDVGILAQQLRIVMMHDRHEEVLALAESGFNAADHHAAVGIADFGADHSHGESALLAQRAGKEIGVIIEFLGGRDDAVLGVLRNGFGVRGIIQDCGDRTLGQSQVFSQFLECGSCRGWVVSCVLGMRSSHRTWNVTTSCGSTQPVFAEWDHFA